MESESAFMKSQDLWSQEDGGALEQWQDERWKTELKHMNAKPCPIPLAMSGENDTYVLYFAFGNRIGD